jgi:hypothetical protein
MVYTTHKNGDFGMVKMALVLPQKTPQFYRKLFMGNSRAIRQRHFPTKPNILVGAERNLEH